MRGTFSPLVPAVCAIAIAASAVVWAEEDAAGSRLARRVASRLLEPGVVQRPPITTDRHHASSIAPVMVPGTSVLFHDSGRLSRNPLDLKYMVSQGRVFSYQDSPHDPLDSPLLRIRPIDGDQEIRFLLQVAVVPQGTITESASLTVAFRAPPLFQPKLAIRGVWVGSRASEFSIDESPAAARLNVHIPLAATDIHTSQDRPRSASVIVEGSLVLTKYQSIAPGQLTDVDHDSLPPEIADLATIEVGRDCATGAHEKHIRSVANEVTATATTDYGKVLAINRFVSSALRYVENPTRRWPVQCLEEGIGDCDDLTLLMIALLRASGIPCRQATGYLYDFNRIGAHAWVEVALPRRGGGLHWFVCEPTIANLVADADTKDRFVQFVGRVNLYPIQPLIMLGNLPADRTTDMLINWRKRDGRVGSDQLELRRVVTDARQLVTTQITERADALVAAGLLLPRELPITPGSPYEISARPVGDSGSQLRVLLENEERIAIELTQRDHEVGLHAEAEQQMIASLRTTFEQLNRLFFEGEASHHILELTFSRDPHSDRLQAVRLQFGRYLVENHFDPVVRRMSHEGLLTEDAADLLKSVHTTSGGMNLYFLQELARYQASTKN